MGIKPLRSLSSGKVFTSGNQASNYHERSQIFRYADMETLSNSIISTDAEVAYQSPQSVHDEYVQRQFSYQSTAEEMDNLNQYIFFLKNSTHSIDLTNLYVPYQIRIKKKGICEQAQEAEYYYPLYEYKMLPQIEARQSRNQNFHQTEIWFLALSVLNALRQFERIKCVNSEFSIHNIKFNSLGCIKIENSMSSPKALDQSRNERMYWSHKNVVNFFIQQTYRLGLVLLEVCSMIPLSTALDYGKNKNKGSMLYSTSSGPGNIERQIPRALQSIQRKYSQLLCNLINVMLCNPRDRPLPSQIYQVLAPYKNDILHFKPFSFNPAMIGSSLHNSYANGSQFDSNPYNSITYGSTQNAYNSFELASKNMFNSLDTVRQDSNMEMKQYPPQRAQQSIGSQQLNSFLKYQQAPSRQSRDKMNQSLDYGYNSRYPRQGQQNRDAEDKRRMADNLRNPSVPGHNRLEYYNRSKTIDNAGRRMNYDYPVHYGAPPVEKANPAVYYNEGSYYPPPSSIYYTRDQVSRMRRNTRPNQHPDGYGTKYAS